MRIGDILYFSPKYRFIDLRWHETENLLDAFADRVQGFYLCPARQLAEHRYAFACGVICVAAIDFIARLVTGEKNSVRARIEKWLSNNIPAFGEPDPDNINQTRARRFYEDFRNKLIHEGRIGNLGQFSLDTKDMVSFVDDAMIVNPEYLLCQLENSFNSYLQQLSQKPEIFEMFRQTLQDDFAKEIERARGS